MGVIVSFGEVMGRFAPEGFLRLRQAMPGRLDITFGGAEANVAASLAMFGANARYVTALPANDLGEACLAELRGLGVDVNCVLRTLGGRLGLYFVETGANQRPSNVIYDREGSAASLASAAEYDWNAIFKDAVWFHTTGITPAISQNAAATALYAVKAAKQAGVKVSCDLNFRKKLWQWDSSLKPRELAERTMREILPYVDVVIANEEDAHDVLGIAAGDSDVEFGKLDIARYPQVAGQIAKQFPNVFKVAITLRESISASHNNWGAMLYDTATGNASFAPMSCGEYKPYEICDIVDRVGGGDSFAAGLIFAMNTPELFADDTAIAYAVASSCLAHSIKSDYNFNTRREVENLMKGSGSGRVVR